MKSIRTLIAVSLLFAATTATLYAQMENRTLMRVNIPFGFIVDDHVLPAGAYSIVAVTADNTIALVSADRKNSLTVRDMPNYAGAASPNSRLVFSRYGNEYFLAEVWTKGDIIARKPFVSDRQKQIAANGQRAESEVILALASH